MKTKRIIDDIEDLISDTKAEKSAKAQLELYLTELLERKREIMDKVDSVTEETIRPLKEESQQIEAEILRIMSETGSERVVSKTYGAFLSDETVIKVINQGKALEWALSHPWVLKKDILKNSEVIKLIKEGIVPDPDRDGVNCNDTYKKISFRRR